MLTPQLSMHMLIHDTGFHDLGGDHYTKHDPERALRRITFSDQTRTDRRSR
ncbi:hypothetical protein [Streptomyces sp. GMR22]|uniref:hypothetical protein n=1 Tax=Streptomyces sp. GMR22 TaxID=2759524 RepID=UPI0015F91265|nr:hypothetical protein [Streptomyces sp. GMR22]MBA6434601.1 hypothetical protein [Streptomyces sp. GMR22]